MKMAKFKMVIDSRNVATLFSNVEFVGGMGNMPDLVRTQAIYPYMATPKVIEHLDNKKLKKGPFDLPRVFRQQFRVVPMSKQEQLDLCQQIEDGIKQFSYIREKMEKRESKEAKAIKAMIKRMQKRK
jgi:hypothetical protein